MSGLTPRCPSCGGTLTVSIEITGTFRLTGAVRVEGARVNIDRGRWFVLSHEGAEGSDADVLCEGCQWNPGLDGFVVRLEDGHLTIHDDAVTRLGEVLDAPEVESPPDDS